MLTIADYDALAGDWVAAYDDRDEAALERLNRHYRRTFSFEDLAAEIWRRVYAFRQRSSRESRRYLKLEEAQMLLAQDAGFNSWTALRDAIITGAPPIPAFDIDTTEQSATPRRQVTTDEWDTLFERMRAQQIATLDAAGLMTDAVLARVSALPHVTRLRLSGSRQVTDTGLRVLADMPQLVDLDLTGVPLTDRGLEVLRQLPNLRRFEMTWAAHISDRGIASLGACEQLDQVNLMGSATGDGAIAALRGKAKLWDFKSGRHVTDAGLPMLHEFPQFKHGERGQLLLDGPFTNEGLASLAGLNGLRALDLFWNVTQITGDGFKHLSALPNLNALAADGALADDLAMTYMGELPRLQRLRAQEAAASDAGFEALSRSRTLEGFWGRDSSGFGDRAFKAFSRLPALRSLGVSCKRVSDQALAAFADFPALCELTPIGIGDDGFRHIAQAKRIERLTCMYCRDTTDIATSYIAGLPLRYYYAGLTQITDRSLEILGSVATLEQIEFYEVNGITNAGLAFLARLPRLREVAFDSTPGVTLAGTQVFPAHVRVRYTT